MPMFIYMQGMTLLPAAGWGLVLALYSRAGLSCLPMLLSFAGCLLLLPLFSAPSNLGCLLAAHQVVRDCKLPEGSKVEFSGVLFQPRSVLLGWGEGRGRGGGGLWVLAQMRWLGTLRVVCPAGSTAYWQLLA